MPKMPLTSETLFALSNGVAGKLVNKHLADLAEDCDERPHDPKPRTLVVTYTFVPEGDGQVDIDVKTKATVPVMKPGSTKAKFDRRAGGLVFNSDCAANPDQTTINDMIDEK